MCEPVMPHPEYRIEKERRLDRLVAKERAHSSGFSNKLTRAQLARVDELKNAFERFKEEVRTTQGLNHCNASQRELRLLMRLCVKKVTYNADDVWRFSNMLGTYEGYSKSQFDLQNEYGFTVDLALFLTGLMNWCPSSKFTLHFSHLALANFALVEPYEDRLEAGKSFRIL